MSSYLKFIAVILIGGFMMAASAGEKKAKVPSTAKSVATSSIKKSTAKTTRGIVQGKTNWSKIKDIFM